LALPGSHILSSSDEDIDVNSTTKSASKIPRNVCLLDSSDEDKKSRKQSKRPKPLIAVEAEPVDNEPAKFNVGKSKYSDEGYTNVNNLDGFTIVSKPKPRRNKVITCLIKSSDDEKPVKKTIKKDITQIQQTTTCFIASSDDETPMTKNPIIKQDDIKMNDEIGMIKLMKTVEESIQNARQISEEITRPKVASPKKQIHIQKKLDYDDNSSNSSNTSSNCGVFDKIDTVKQPIKQPVIEIHDDGYSSDSEPDSPPMRPQSKEIKRVYRKKSNSPKKSIK
jgi:hypothetical protein